MSTPDSKKPRGGYFTQCDSGGYTHFKCDETARLDTPRRWRCPSCVKRFGPRRVEEDED